MVYWNYYIAVYTNCMLVWLYLKLAPNRYPAENTFSLLLFMKGFCNYYYVFPEYPVIQYYQNHVMIYPRIDKDQLKINSSSHLKNNCFHCLVHTNQCSYYLQRIKFLMLHYDIFKILISKRSRSPGGIGMGCNVKNTWSFGCLGRQHLRR